MLKLKKINKKAQVGETVTWIVATVIIILVLLVAIFIASLSLGNLKKIQESSFQTTDILASKSLFSYSLTEDSEGNSVYSSLKEKGEFNQFNGELAQNIFLGLYEDEYGDVWFGIRPPTSNDYFGSRPTQIKGGDITFGSRSIQGVLERIKLDQEKTLELYLAEEVSIK